MKTRKWVRVLVAVGIAGGSLALVFKPLDAVDEEVTHAPGELVKDISRFRDEPIRGDAWVLDSVKERGWARIGGTIVYSSRDVITKDRVVITEDGFTIDRNDQLADAVIDRVMVSNDGERIRIFDHRLEPCPTQGDLPSGKIYDVGGAPLVEPTSMELTGLTNHELVNTLVAPAFWFRSELAVRAKEVAHDGEDKISGRTVDKYVFEMNVMPEDGRRATETLWIDREANVVLRRIREGREPVRPGSKEMEAFRQEWRIENVQFDQEVTTRLALEELVLERGTDILYRISTPVPVGIEDRQEQLEQPTTVREIVDSSLPDDAEEHVITDCAKA